MKLKLESLCTVVWRGLFSGLFSSYAACLLLLLDVVEASQHRGLLGVEIELPLGPVDPKAILPVLHADGDPVTIESNGLAAVPSRLPLAEWESLSTVGSIPNLLFAPLRVHVVVGELAGANTTNPNDPIV